MSDRVEAFANAFERALQEKAHELACKAILRPTEMVEKDWRQLNALFAGFHEEWRRAWRPDPPSLITFDSSEPKPSKGH